jgi:AbrB family looped-hinge helix DNA binding protein
MAATKMTRKGQVTIPAEIREALGLHVGDHFIVHAVDGKVVLESQRDMVRRTAGVFAEYAKNLPVLEPDQIRELAARYIAEEVLQSMRDEAAQSGEEDQ